MRRLSVYLFTVLVLLSSHSYAACKGEQCKAVLCDENQLISIEDGMLDFCQPPSYGTFSIEKDGVTWIFGQSVASGKFVNGDYWVLDKGDGVKVTKVTPGPEGGHNGSMINPTVGFQAYDKDIASYDASKLVTFPVVLKAGDSLVSTVSVKESDLNQYGNIDPSWYSYSKGVKHFHAKLKNASVLTVVSEVPKFGSFRPTYIGTKKTIYNIGDIDTGLLPNYKAPSTLPDVSYYERGVERPWLMHLYHYNNRKMHPVENMPNYHREVGRFLSELSLVLMTDAKTPKLLYGFIQTGIDHYATITSGKADNATFEFHSILTGLLLSDEEMASLWINGDSQTLGRATEKFYMPDDKLSTLSSSLVDNGKTWTGHGVMFRKKRGDAEHEHLHPSEWSKIPTNGGGIKNETYRLCCDSTPHFGMALTSRVLNAGKYWPNSALDKYMDRWVWESQNGYGSEVIKQYYPNFKFGTRKYLLGGKFIDSMYELAIAGSQVNAISVDDDIQSSNTVTEPVTTSREYIEYEPKSGVVTQSSSTVTINSEGSSVNTSPTEATIESESNDVQAPVLRGR